MTADAESATYKSKKVPNTSKFATQPADHGFVAIAHLQRIAGGVRAVRYINQYA